MSVWCGQGVYSSLLFFSKFVILMESNDIDLICSAQCLEASIKVYKEPGGGGTCL